MFEPKIKLNRLEFDEKDILRYEQQPIEEGLIMFYGSSCFTRWSEHRNNPSLEKEILRKDGSRAIVNHGFGTSTVEELLYYYPRLVRPWKPRAMVITCYLNDYTYNYSVEEVMFLLKRLLEYARTDMPGIRFYLADIHHTTNHIDEKEKWSPFKHYRKQINAELKAYCEAHDDCTYLCHADFPLFYEKAEDVGDYDKVRRDLFVEDKVHYTPEGYQIYKEFYRQALDEIL